MKEQFHKHAKPHSFQINDKVLITNDFDSELVPNWKGPLRSLTLMTPMRKSKLKIKLKCSMSQN